MKILLLGCLPVLFCLSFSSCKKHEHFQTEVSAYPEGYVGKWQIIIKRPKNPWVFQAGLTIKESKDSLHWQYFSQTVDTTNNRIMPCGREMVFLPVFWDDSLHRVQADHGIGQGGGYDFLQLLKPDQLQVSSFMLAPECRGPFGMDAIRLVFSKVDQFSYKQPAR